VWKVKLKLIFSLFVILSATFYAIYLIYPVNKTTRLGLDLKGGLSVVLTAKDAPKAPVDEESLKKAELVIRERVDSLGVAESTIQRLGERNLLIQLPGIKNPQEALEIIGKQAVLQFAIVLSQHEHMGVRELNQLKKRGHPVVGPVILTGKHLKNAGAFQGGPVAARPIVVMSFDQKGQKMLAKVTRENIGRRLAIILDGKIIDAPLIKEPITTGQAFIQGIKTKEEADKIALVLKSGALPVEMEVSEAQAVGPTLGHDSLVKGLIAGLIGLTLVAIYLVAYYWSFGFISILSLTIFTLIFWGSIVLLGHFLNWNLTLPSIAGIIISIGIAADSNIVVYERVKEELNKGKSLVDSVAGSFWGAFRTILDADLATWLVAAILFFLSVGPLKGFALALALGLLIDLLATLLFLQPAIRLLAESQFGKYALPVRKSGREEE
jgi:preprotein translocase subunit SecD